MKYLENELDLIDWLEKWENREILADWLNEEASLGEIDDIVNMVNNALLYRKYKNKKEK